MNRRGACHSILSLCRSKRDVPKDGAPYFVKNHIMSKIKIIKIIVSVLIAALTALGAAFGLNSCNVVRTITNKSEYYQRGDTSIVIQTKTTESYDATKKL